jgi:hypothetical protein
MNLEERQRQKVQLDWRWRKLNRVPMMSKEFDWLEWEIFTDDLAEWYCEGPVMRELSARILRKRREKRETGNGDL